MQCNLFNVIKINHTIIVIFISLFVIQYLYVLIFVFLFHGSCQQYALFFW